MRTHRLDLDLSQSVSVGHQQTCPYNFLPILSISTHNVDSDKYGSLLRAVFCPYHLILVRTIVVRAFLVSVPWSNVHSESYFDHFVSTITYTLVF